MALLAKRVSGLSRAEQLSSRPVSSEPGACCALFSLCLFVFFTHILLFCSISTIIIIIPVISSIFLYFCVAIDAVSGCSVLRCCLSTQRDKLFLASWGCATSVRKVPSSSSVSRPAVTFHHSPPILIAQEAKKGDFPSHIPIPIYNTPLTLVYLPSVLRTLLHV